MGFLTRERDALERFLPGLDATLAEMPFEELESDRSQGIAAFREAGGPGLLVPEEHRGRGASAVDGVRVQRAIAARSPSLAVGTAMHHFSAATLLELWKIEHGLEWMLLRAVGEGQVLLASGFAEGVRGQGILAPTMRGRREGSDVVIDGTKRPCSLSRSMDILTTSVVIRDEDPSVPDEFTVALVPANAEGVSVTPFWGATLLAGAESDAVTLTDVRVEKDLLISMGGSGGAQLGRVETAGFLWFVLLITSSYVGMASALVERLLGAGGSAAEARLRAATELEATAAGLEGVAARLDAGEASSDLLTTALLCRYAGQDAIARAVATASEHLGGMAFVMDDRASYFAGASRALAFHPPSRPKNAQNVIDALGGAELVIT